MNDDQSQDVLLTQIDIVKNLVDVRVLPELPMPRIRHPRKKKRPNTALIAEYAHEAMLRRLGGEL